MRIVVHLEGLFPQGHSSYLLPLTSYLNSFSLRFFLDGHLAAIVTAGGTNGVIDVILAAVGAYGQRWSYSSVVCSSLKGPCLGLPSFWMCHFLFTI